MIRKSKRQICAVTVICIFIMGCAILYAFIRHEYKQDEKIKLLNAEVELLYSELEGMSSDISFPEDTYNYLAIGNSITLHDKCNFWWNQCGMAASKESEDYFHKLCVKLEEEYGPITAYPYNFSVWEIMGTDRAETLHVLDTYLSENLDLVTIQLGENATNLDDYEDDYEYLLEYITDSVSEQCRIIVIGDFWENGERDQMKKRACSGGVLRMLI